MHRTVGKQVALGNVKYLFTIGKGGNAIAEGAIENGFPAENVFRNPDPANLSPLIATLLSVLQTGDTVLFKASRKIAAERAGSALKNFLWKKEGGNRA